MSAVQNTYNNEDTMNHHDNDDDNDDRVVTDSVHERFRQAHVRCDDCGIDVVGNEAAIKKHFNNSHPSNRYCRYCKGKVFIYRQVMTRDGNQTSQDFVYHKCERNEQETNESK